MTFTQTVKAEILRGIGKPEPYCRKAYLSSLIRSAGTIGFGASGFSLTFYSKNEKLVGFIEKLITEDYPECGYAVTSDAKTKVFGTEVRDSARMLRECGIISAGKFLELVDGISDLFTDRECCAKSYLTGLFLGCGTVKIPIASDLTEDVKGGYHLELALFNFDTALDTVHLFSEFGFDAGLGYRKEKQLVYFKDGETISDLLAFFGAGGGVMTIQNSIAARSIRADANRAGNCISANIDKAVAAAQNQLRAIEYIEKTDGLDSLSPQMKETAILRKAYPEATLEELTEKHNGVSKSGVNHRLRGIVRIAREREER